MLENDTADLNNTQFRKNLLKYNKHDCYILYSIIKAFNKNFKELFNREILDSPTLPSLAFKLFTKKYNKEDIEITYHEDYINYKEAYRGGAVDVYKPHGKNLYCYDVNSLYPYVMSANEYPTGPSSYFKGKIFKLENMFGIVKVKVEAPDNLYAPILLTKTDDGKVIAPIGSWTGWYCTEELKLAKKYGYKFEMLEGYHWPNKNFIFKEYVDTLYNIRLSYEKTDPRNLICKLLLNSLYGKFGMNPKVSAFYFYNSAEALEKKSDGSWDEEDWLNLDKIGNYYVKELEETKNSLFWLNIAEEKKERYNLMQISTPIAIFTTAYARMHMAELKMKYKNNIYYSDTDSIFLDVPLPDSDVGKELGKMKLEYKIDEAVFIAPKVYALKLVGDRPADGVPQLAEPESNIIVKVKGSKNKDIPGGALASFKLLLNKDEVLKLNPEKWYKNMNRGDISILNTLYTLKATENKRNFIYKDNKIVDSTPIRLKK